MPVFRGSTESIEDAEAAETTKRPVLVLTDCRTRNTQEMKIGEVEELLQRRGILKDPVLANKAAVMQKEREAKEAEMRAASAEKERVVT